MSKHTPGPWAVNPQTRGDADISVYAILGSGNPHWIARAYGGGPLAPPSPVTAANARLIAAGPDLLAACEAALASEACVCAEIADTDAAGSCLACVLFDAIRKARGD